MSNLIHLLHSSEAEGKQFYYLNIRLEKIRSQEAKGSLPLIGQAPQLHSINYLMSKGYALMRREKINSF